MSLPQCIEGCPQHATRVRHKQRHRSRTVSKTSFGEGCAQHETRSGQQSANPAFEGGHAGPAGPGLSSVYGGSREYKRFWGSGGSRGFQRRSRGRPEVLGGKTAKTRKTRKTRSCVARLLRSSIQEFVQEVLVGQMAQGTPFRCLPWPPLTRGRLNLPSVQHATQGSADMYIGIVSYTYMYQVISSIRMAYAHIHRSKHVDPHIYLYVYICICRSICIYIYV